MLKQVALLSLMGALSPAFGQALPTNTPPAPGAASVRVISPHSANVATVPPRPAGNAPNAATTIPSAYRPLPEDLLAWNGETQETKVKFGSPQTFMSFSVTNVSKEPITISRVSTSCGCTVPKLPTMPWTIAPGSNGTIDVTMNLAGKRGTVIKTVTLNTDHGFKTLFVRTIIEEPPAGAMGQSDRMQNLQVAMANRQAVFQGDCATCHATPALNKTGAELYEKACDICHGAEHRASMVPDLRNLQKDTNADYWRTWITSSAEGKLMPAFAIKHGGFLNTMQIESLVNYLMETIPLEQSAAPSAPPPAAH